MSCYLCFVTMPPVDAIEEPGGVIVSYGEDGEPVSRGVPERFCTQS